MLVLHTQINPPLKMAAEPAWSAERLIACAADIRAKGFHGEPERLFEAFHFLQEGKVFSGLRLCHHRVKDDLEWRDFGCPTSGGTHDSMEVTVEAFIIFEGKHYLLKSVLLYEASCAGHTGGLECIDNVRVVDEAFSWPSMEEVVKAAAFADAFAFLHHIGRGMSACPSPETSYVPDEWSGGDKVVWLPKEAAFKDHAYSVIKYDNDKGEDEEDDEDEEDESGKSW